MTRHYSSSAPVNWLRKKIFKINKPRALPWGEWDQWDDDLKKNRPIAYFITEVLPEWAEWLPEHTIGKFDKLRIWVSNYQNNTHGLQSNLSKGQWHEFDQRVLHSVFDSYIDFIECEEAWNHVIWLDGDDILKYPTTKWYGIFQRKGKKWRSAKAGLDHLKWEMTLTEDGVPTHQATSALEKLTLYMWWKEIRPNRKDEWDESGFRKFWEEMDKKYGDNGWLGLGGKGLLNSIEAKRYEELSNAKDQLEEQHNKEDDDMLLRLIQIRKTLWT